MLSHSFKKTMAFYEKPLSVYHCYFSVFYLVILAVVSVECINVSDSECINNSSVMDGFIVGGEKTIISKFPHAVCLFHYPLYRFFCGGSVLNQRVVLTAAHCVDGDGQFTLDVYAGHEDLEKVTVIRRVSRFIEHENYNKETTANDIALLFIDELPLPIGGNTMIKRVIISKEFPLHVKMAEICGWGYVNDATRETSAILKATKQKIIPFEECQETYFYEWEPGVMCAGDAFISENRPARGDSGGGLMTSDHQQIGLVSYATGEEPGLIFYTNISIFYDWIVHLVENKICG